MYVLIHMHWKWKGIHRLKRVNPLGESQFLFIHEV